MSGQQFLVCVRWADRARILCMQRECFHCAAIVAIDAKNAEAARNLVPVCIGCARELIPDLSLKSSPSLIGGKEYRDPKKALLAAQALLGRN